MCADGALDADSVPARPRAAENYNASSEFIDRHLLEGHGERLAVIDDHGQYTYAELAERINRAANVLSGLGAGMEARVLLCLVDSVDFVALFWGALKIGAVPIPVNTLFGASDYDFILRDSRARLLFISESLRDKIAPIIENQPYLAQVIPVGDGANGRFAELAAKAHPEVDVADTGADDVAFWLYTSGSTGPPKGVVHVHGSLAHTAECYGVGILGLTAQDRVFSAAKLFFAYGLGNAMTFPFFAGASVVLLAERPTPESVAATLYRHEPTVFFGVPTLYAAMLADPSINAEQIRRALRLCVSAGEPLPEDTARRWQQRFGRVPLDGIGSTEMLHIFLSNRADDYRFGTTGKAVPGYALKVLTDEGTEAAAGETGELLVKGASSAMCYWRQRAKSRDTFLGDWTRTGDKYFCDEDGYYHYSGRTDDMLKVSGQWVSPFDVEFALISHPDVLEAAVVGQMDANGLVKPKAYVVPAGGIMPSAGLEAELKQYVKDRLAPFKYPRWIEFLPDLPKTATGKIQRFKLRGERA